MAESLQNQDVQCDTILTSEHDNISHADNIEEQALIPFAVRNVISYSNSQISLNEDLWEKIEREEIENLQYKEYFKKGFVYAASNPFFGTLLKIGATTKTPFERLKALSRTSVPEPFFLVACVSTIDPFGLERKIHKYFESRRKYGRKNEFFDVSEMEVFQLFASDMVRTWNGSTDAYNTKTKKETSATSKTISFSRSGASVRVTDDGLLYAVDLVMAITGKNRNDAALAIRNLHSGVFDPGDFVKRQTSTRGGHMTKLLTYDNAINLVMVLPGRLAKEARVGFADFIKRYYAHDAPLMGEIDAPVDAQVIGSFVDVLAAPVAESPQAMAAETSKKVHPNQARDTAICDFMKKLFAEAFEEKIGHFLAFGDIYDVFAKSRGVVTEKEDRQFRFYCKALIMAQWPDAVHCVHQKRRCYRNVAVKAN